MAHHDYLAAARAGGLEQDRVHRRLELDPGRGRLDGLRTADLAAVARHDGVERHVLRLERGDAYPLSREPAAEPGGEHRLAGVGVGAAHEDRALPAPAPAQS